MAQDTGDNITAEAAATDDPSSESNERPVDQQEVSKQGPETETGKNDEEGEVPKDNAAWAQMRLENKRLKETIADVDPEYFEKLRGATQPQVYQGQQTPQVSADDDYSKVTQNLNWTSNQASQAVREVRNLQAQLELQQDREAERAYPEMKTNKVFQQIVAEKKLAARVLGHQKTTLEIADEVNRLFKQRDEEVTAKTTQQVKETILERHAISSEPRGQTTGGRSGVSNEELRMRVRKGDSAAQEEVAKGLIADLEF